METFTITALRPHRLVLDRGDAHWRGGQVTSIVGAIATITLLAEQSMVRVKTCATSLIPNDARTIGTPVACRVTGDNADAYTIAEVFGSSFADPPKGGDQAGSVARGEFRPGVVPRTLTNEPIAYWSATQTRW